MKNHSLMKSIHKCTIDRRIIAGLCGIGAILSFSGQAGAQSFSFSTGTPDGLIATASRPGGAGLQEIESADDFFLNKGVSINQATFTGLIPAGASINQVVVEIYRVFPKDSGAFDNRVTTRNNSPSDVAFATRDSSLGQLSFTTSVLNNNFSAANSVINGIHIAPGQFTGGEGPVSGQEVQFTVNFKTPLDLSSDHYFFIPQVALDNGDFLWLSAPKPIGAGGTPFLPDLQSWIRNSDLDPDWSRVGTDITHSGPFNASFSLSGTVPDIGSSAQLLGLALFGLAGCVWHQNRNALRPQNLSKERFSKA